MWSVCCPKCKREHHEQLDGVVSEWNPHFRCRYCDWTGPLTSKNPGQARPEPQTLFDYFLSKYEK